jgi:predicted nucleic acid-binding protein
MILLDTNVVAELMRPAPLPAVVRWLNEQDAGDLYLTTITIGEIGYGVAILPSGKRRAVLEEGFRKVLGIFADRILAFDTEAAGQYGPLMAERRSAGRPLGISDGQIASIAVAQGATVATRNIRDFEGCSVDLIDPFAKSP